MQTQQYSNKLGTSLQFYSFASEMLMQINYFAHSLSPSPSPSSLLNDAAAIATSI
jgi:hypothetical protein